MVLHPPKFGSSACSYDVRYEINGYNGEMALNKIFVMRCMTVCQVVSQRMQGSGTGHVDTTFVFCNKKIPPSSPFPFILCTWLLLGKMH